MRQCPSWVGDPVSCSPFLGESAYFFGLSLDTEVALRAPQKVRLPHFDVAISKWGMPPRCRLRTLHRSDRLMGNGGVVALGACTNDPTSAAQKPNSGRPQSTIWTPNGHTEGDRRSRWPTSRRTSSPVDGGQGRRWPKPQPALAGQPLGASEDCRAVLPFDRWRSPARWCRTANLRDRLHDELQMDGRDDRCLDRDSSPLGS